MNFQALKITITHTSEIVVEPTDKEEFQQALEKHRYQMNLPITEDGFYEMIARNVEREGLGAATQFHAKAYIINQDTKTRINLHTW